MDSDFQQALRFARLQRGSVLSLRVFTPSVGDRPAQPRRDRSWILLMLALGSTVAHGAVLTLFENKPTPLANAGLQVISVELVQALDTMAGAATPPDPLQDNVHREPMPAEGEDLLRTRLAAVDTQGVEATSSVEAVAPREPTPAEIEAPMQAQAAEALPPTPRPRPVAKPPTNTQAKPDARSREAALQLAPESDMERRSRQVLASNMASGTGTGHADASPEYRGVVAAHLARYKQFPDEARRTGAQGSAVMSFGLDSDGRVMSVELVSGAGYPSLDQEARAMVHRASPFPAPPGGRAVNFTVPVAFNLR